MNALAYVVSWPLLGVLAGFALSAAVGLLLNRRNRRHRR